MKATRPEPRLLPSSIDWRRDLGYFLVNNSHQDGYVDASWDVLQPPFEHANALTTPALRSAWLATASLPSLFDPSPVAIGSASPMTVVEGCAGEGQGRVTFSHEASFQGSPNHKIADHQWLFEVANPAHPPFEAVSWAALPDGSWSADGKAFHTTSRSGGPTATYLRSGTYHAALRVVDDNSPPRADVHVVRNIVVGAQAPVPPTCGSGGPYAMSAGEALVLSGTMQDANLSCRPAEILTAGWTVDGNPVPDLASPAGAIPWATLSSMGLGRNTPLAMRLRVADSTGRFTECDTTLAIYDRDPIACFAVSTSSVKYGQSIALDASCSSHPDPRRAIVSYEWDYDVDEDAGSPFEAESSGEVQEHAYSSAGSFRPTLRVTDDAGTSATAQQVVEVLPPPRAVDEAYGTAEDVPLVVPAPGLLANDLYFELDDPQRAVLAAGPAHGALALQEDGSFIYTPEPGFSGTDQFTYQASDGGPSLWGPATVTLTVTPAPEPARSPAGGCGCGAGSRDGAETAGWWALLVLLALAGRGRSSSLRSSR